VHNTLELPGSLFEVITFWIGECFGFSFSIVCSVLRLRLKDLDLPLALSLEMAFCLWLIRWGGDDRLGAPKRIIGIIPPLSAFLLERGIPQKHPSQAPRRHTAAPRRGSSRH